MGLGREARPGAPALPPLSCRRAVGVLRAAALPPVGPGGVRVLPRGAAVKTRPAGARGELAARPRPLRDHGVPVMSRVALASGRVTASRGAPPVSCFCNESAQPHGLTFHLVIPEARVCTGPPGLLLWGVRGRPSSRPFLSVQTACVAAPLLHLQTGSARPAPGHAHTPLSTPGAPQEHPGGPPRRKVGADLDPACSFNPPWP